MAMRLSVALLLPALLAACGAASPVDTAPSAARAAATPLPTGGLRAEPGQSVVLYHCGVLNISYEGREWEVENDPFDATNAPDTFSGLGSFEREGDGLVFTDDKGATLVFTPWDGETDPYVCG